MSKSLRFASVLGLLGLAGVGATRAEGQAQTVVSGQVTAEGGRPLSGATVAIPELNAGSLVNEAGRYSMVIPAARVHGQTVSIVARFIGYRPATKSVTLAAGTQTVDFALALDPTKLSEVVVTGVTGETERAKVPFSVAHIDTTDMPVKAVNALSQLQGKVPGANIASTTGRPGQAPTVILRGPTSINAQGRGQEPLYIVDGVILGSSIADINPADIESVEVVKGAAASSLYGSRAGAGVIQIRTKHGRGGADGTTFSARQEYGMNDIERDFGISRNNAFLYDETGTRFCVLDAYGTNNLCSRTIDYLAEQRRINNVPGDFAASPPAFPIDPGSVTSGDILRRAFIVNQYPTKTYNAVAQIVDPKPISISDLSMSARYGQTQLYASTNYTKQGGAIMGLRGYDRVNGRLNLDQRFNDQWSLQATTYLSRSEQDGSNQEEGGTGFFRLTRTPAIVDITQRDSLGRLFIRPNLQAGGVQNENPLYSFENIHRSDVRVRYITGATLKYAPLDWLDGEANFSYDRLNLTYSQFQDRNFRTTNSNVSENEGRLTNGAGNTAALNTSAQLTARRQLLSDLTSRFNVRWLFEQQDLDDRYIRGNRLKIAGVPTATNITNFLATPSTIARTRQMSYSAGAFFDYKDRYTTDLLVREDGSSRFGRDQRWQTYGRASGAWLVGREPWWFTDKISQFVLRASLGTAGNAPPYVAQYEAYRIDQGAIFTAVALGNPNLKPEVVTELELGGEIELLNRYSLTLTHAFSRSKNQILPTAVSVTTGFPTQWRNAGSLDNTTWEASLNIPIIQGANASWSTRFNYASNRAIISKLNVAPFFIGTDLQGTNGIIKIDEGLRYGTFFGRRFVTSCSELPQAFQGQCGGPTSAFQKNSDGYIVWVGAGNNPSMGITDNLWNTILPAGQAPWGVQASWGMPMLVRDNCGKPECAPKISALGHALPDYRIGWSHTVTYRGLSLYGLVDGAFGQSTYNQGRHWAYLDFLSKDVDQTKASVATAKPIGYYFRAGPGPSGGTGIGGFYDVLGPNNRFTENSSYLKLREVSASYHVGRFGPGDWTASVIGRNLKTWTRYTGFDPEVGVGATNNDSGSGLVNAVDAFTFPQLRSVSFVISAGF